MITIEPLPLVAFLGVLLALLGSLSGLLSRDCRRQVARARIEARARRLEEARRDRIRASFAAAEMPTLVGTDVARED